MARYKTKSKQKPSLSKSGFITSDKLTWEKRENFSPIAAAASSLQQDNADNYNYSRKTRIKKKEKKKDIKLEP